MKKRILSLFLVFCMVFGMLPTSAFAKGIETTPISTNIIAEEGASEEGVPEGSVPEESTPEESAPEEGTPEESVPEESTPEESVPEESTPEESVPEESTPEESVPEESTPEESVPEESIPEESVPEVSTPEESAPEESTPEEGVPEVSTPEEQEKEPAVMMFEAIPRSARNNPVLSISDGNIILSVSGDNKQYTIGNGTPTTYTGEFTIYRAGGVSTQNTVTVESGTHDITLNGVNIDVSALPDTCAFEVQNGATANITLINISTMISGKDKAGLQVQTGATVSIDGTGALNATGGEFGAGIGGSNFNSGGTITINGGTVTATGGYSGAGIGGGANKSGGSGGTITIDGTANVTAIGGKFGAGIGGGARGAGGTITITDGTVTATGGSGGAGIGGGNNGAGGTINITGGTVTAIGSKDSSSNYCGAGIGGGSFKSGGTIKIDGTADVTATGGSGGAGIGGGYDGTGGNIIVDGTTKVTATGGTNGAGIGGGYKGTGGSININGGIVTATGGHNGAGIGGGYKGTGGNITVTVGTVTATGGEFAAGIGGGISGSGDVININGGSVTATGGRSGAGIGGGTRGAGGSININGGTVTAQGGAGRIAGISGAGIGGGIEGSGGTIAIDGKATVIAVSDNETSPAIHDADNTISGAANVLMANYKAMVDGGIATTIKNSSGANLTPTISHTPTGSYQSIAFTVPSAADYTVFKGETQQAYGSNSTVFTVNQGLNSFTGVKDYVLPPAAGDINDGNIILSVSGDNKQYKIGNGTPTTYTGEFTINHAGGVATQNTVIVESGTHDITLNGVNIDVSDKFLSCAFEVQNGATANITLTGSNTLQSGSGKAGLQVKTGATVIIDGTGTLNVTGGYRSAGIGGNQRDAGGSITISGGTITATGGYEYSAGIGGGLSGAGGTITISGGTVIARGSYQGAGIGGGFKGECGTITINGGNITATGAGGGAGIGGGSQSAGGGDITISDTATVIATGGYNGVGIGGGEYATGCNITIDDIATVIAVSNNETNPAIYDADNIISGAANVLVANYKERVTAGTATTIKDASGADLTPTISHTPTGTYQSIAFTVPSAASYTVFKGETQQAYGSNVATFTVNQGLNPFTDVKDNGTPTPNIKIRYNDETLYNFVNGAQYTINGTNVTPKSDGTVAIDETWFGTTLSIVRKGGSIPDSKAQSLSVPARPTAPPAVFENGKITGLDKSIRYEISVDGGKTWVSANLTNGDIVGLTPMEYQVRQAASGDYETFAGESTTGTVTPFPVVYGTNIYANGVALIITGDADANTTTIYIDTDRDGVLDDGELSLNASGVVNAPEDNADLSSSSVFGGSFTKKGQNEGTTYSIKGDTQITMLGGKVFVIVGGGDNTNVNGDTSICVKEGMIRFGILGGGDDANVSGSTHINIDGGQMDGIVGGSISNDNSTQVGNTNITITGGKIQRIVLAGGFVREMNRSYNGSSGITSTVIGKKSIKVSGNPSISGNGIAINKETVSDFTINSPLQEGAAVAVSLSEDVVDNQIIVHNAQASDFKKVSISKYSAPNKTLYYDSSDSTIKVGTAYTITVIGGRADKATERAGETITITADPAAKGKIFDKWTTTDGIAFADESKSQTTFTMPNKAVTVTATYKDIPKGSIGGKVTEKKDGSPVADAKVEVRKSNESNVIAEDTTDIDGSYTISDIPYGVYSLVVTHGTGADERTHTSIITIGSVNTSKNVQLLSGKKDTVLEVKPGGTPPALAVDNLEDMFDGKEPKDKATEIKLVVADETMNKPDKTTIENKLSGAEKVGIYLDAALVKTVEGETPEYIQPPSDKKIKIVIDVPIDLQNKGPYCVIRVHDGVAEKFDAKYDTTYHTLSFEADKFSTYAIAYVDPAVTTYQLTISGGGTGETGVGQYKASEVVPIYAGTKSDYTFSHWTSSNGGIFGDKKNSQTTFTMPANDITITANWTKNNGGSSGGGSSYDYYDIKISKEGNGTISPDGGSDNTFSVREWSDKNFAFTPDKGYAVSDVLVDGKSLGAKSSYTFENVRRDHTLKVIFKVSGHKNPQTGVFVDVKEDDWFYEYVINTVEKSWFAGTSDTTFSPYLSTTRGMIATVLHRMEQSPIVLASSVFEDVLADSWYFNSVTWAQENEVVRGYGNGQYGPNDNITREQMAAILYRYASFKGYDVSKRANLDNFTDDKQISSYAIEAIQWAVANGLLSGKGDNVLDPKGNATRAEVATILTRFDNLFKKQ